MRGSPRALSLILAGALSASTPLVLADACLTDPVAIPQNMVTSVFGKTRDLPQYSGVPHVHWGVDFQARNLSDPSRGADLLAASQGTVVGAGFWGSGYGNRVAIKRPNGDMLVYSHLASIEPHLKSGGAVGFKNDGGPVVGTAQVNAGDKVGVAGGTANHASSNDRAIHLHLEYVTGFSGTALRETNDGTNTTRSRYMRNAVDYMCKAPTAAPGAGTSPPPATDTGAGLQAATAAAAQPSVTNRDRYGTPDAPPYDQYAGLSESQIIEAEMLRRALDTEWETNLTQWGKRGIWMEVSRMDGVMLWLDDKISEKRSRIETMLALLTAQRANQFFTPRLRSAQQEAERISAATRVN